MGGAVWIFGYGSLVWKTDFPYEKRLVGYVTGYLRRFWQASVDHRGTHEKPGRVVTLVPSEDKDARVWGAAYLIEEGKEEETWANLGIREITYGPVKSATFYPKDANSDARGIFVHVYIAPSEGPLFLGPTCPKVAAQQIISSCGPSGKNLEYFQRLIAFLRDECPPGSLDQHVIEIQHVIDDILPGNKSCE